MDHKAVSAEPCPQTINNHPVGVVVLPAGVIGRNEIGKILLPGNFLPEEKLKEPRQLRRQKKNPSDLNELSAICHGYIIDNWRRCVKTI